MTQDAFSIVVAVFSNMWKLFTGWYIPGTNITPAGFWLFVGSIVVVTGFLGRLGFASQVSMFKSDLNHDRGDKT